MSSKLFVRAMIERHGHKWDGQFACDWMITAAHAFLRGIQTSKQLRITLADVEGALERYKTLRGHGLSDRAAMEQLATWCLVDVAGSDSPATRGRPTA